jgi:hypothetical protein
MTDVIQNYSLELVKARLSQCYDKGNIKFDYCGVELYLHAFPATALVGDVLLTSTTHGYFPAERNTGSY